MSEQRHGWAECLDCRHRWYVVLAPWESADWIDCPECGEQGRMVKYVTPDAVAPRGPGRR